LEDSIHGNPVFKQWARAWSKRTIIQSAIKAIGPTPGRHGAIPETAEAHWQNGDDVESIAAVVASWEPFERFVFVMAVLEGYSLRECAALLACPVQDVIAAKSLALQRLAAQSSTEVVSPDRQYLRRNKGFARAQVA
jgi:DNA-directed RNA polymerase specialized sigma24 family protein